MLGAIERATRQKITPLTMPTPNEVANRRVAQFTTQVLDTLKEEKLEFFFDVVRRIENENEIGAREIAAALAFLAQKDRPLQLPGHQTSATTETPKPRASGRDTSSVGAGETPSRTRAPRETSPYALSDDDSVPAKRERAPRQPKEPRIDYAPGALARYRIEIGRNQGVMPKEIVGAIANEGGIDGKQIGQINLFDDYSSVELPGNLPADVLDVLKRIRVRQFALKTRVMEPGEFVEESRAPRRAPSTTRKPFDGPRKSFDGPKKDFDKPRKAYDGPRSGDAPPRSRPPFESSRKPSGAVRKVSLPPRSKTPR